MATEGWQAGGPARQCQQGDKCANQSDVAALLARGAVAADRQPRRTSPWEGMRSGIGHELRATVPLPLERTDRWRLPSGPSSSGAACPPPSAVAFTKGLPNSSATLQGLEGVLAPGLPDRPSLMVPTPGLKAPAAVPLPPLCCSRWMRNDFTHDSTVSKQGCANTCIQDWTWSVDMECRHGVSQECLHVSTNRQSCQGQP